METEQNGEEDGVTYADQESGNNVVIQIRGKAGTAANEPIQVKEVVSEKWLDARMQILKLLDDEISRDEKTRIVDELCTLVESVSKGVTLNVEPGEGAKNAISWTLSEYEGSSGAAAAVPRKSPHRLPLADVNHHLFSLSDTISSVKNKMLLGRRDQQRDRINSVVDIQVCRQIHRNFRRILQKESRFLRDELFSARERIYRLERKYVSGGSRSSRSSSRNGEKMVVEQSAYSQQNLASTTAVTPTAKIVPYYDLSVYHPLNFINLMEPQTAAIVPAYPSWYTTSHINSADRLYYHCDFYRPIPVGYEPLSGAVNFNEMPPPPPPPPRPPPPPTPPSSLLPSQIHLNESIVYDHQSRSKQQNSNHPSLKFTNDNFSTDQCFHNKDES